MNKAYNRIVWENYPSEQTPLNETNLNKMDAAVDEIDNRVVEIDTTKLDKSTAATMVKTISFDESTGIFTVTLLNGSSYTLDTKLEKLAVNFGYDPEAQQLVIVLDDGTEQRVDMSALITQYEFLDSDTVAFTVGSDGKVSADIKNFSITEDKLQPNFLADCRAEVENAKSEVTKAAEQVQMAKRYAVGGVIESDVKDNAKYYSELSAEYAKKAEEYSQIAYPELHIDLDTGELVSEKGIGISFSIDSDGYLIGEVTM